MKANGTADALIEQERKKSGQNVPLPENYQHPPHRRITSNSAHAIANRASYHKTQGAREANTWATQFMHQHPELAENLQKLMGTPAGRELLPELDKVYNEANAGATNRANLKQFFDLLPKHSSHRQPAAAIFGAGKTIAETSEELNISKSMAKTSKTTNSKVKAVQSTFVNAVYEFGTTRTKVVEIFAQEIVDHFCTGMTYVSSGSANDSRSLPLTKEEAYKGFREAFPGIILRTLAKHPSLRADPKTRDAKNPKFTLLQRNIEAVVSGNFTLARWAEDERSARRRITKTKICGRDELISPGGTVLIKGGYPEVVDGAMAGIDDIGEERIDIVGLKCAIKPSGVISRDAAISPPDLTRRVFGEDDCREGDPEDCKEDGPNHREETKHECDVTMESEEGYEGFKPKLPEVKPLSYACYWKIIEAKVKYKMVSQPHSCTYHRRAPFVRGSLKRIQAARVDGTFEKLTTKGKKKIDVLNQQLDFELKKIERHERQFECQRAYLQEVEANLPKRSPDQFEVIVYEDYVGTYGLDAAVKRVNNLVMSFIWRDENGILQRKYINNITASSDATFGSDSQCTHQTWGAHLKPNRLMHKLKTLDPKNSQEARTIKSDLTQLKKDMNGVFEFEGVTKITRSGDSGSHFHNRLMMNFESEVYETTGIIWETQLLCKLHAYNLCDAHGGAIKRKFRRAYVSGFRPLRALHFAAIINDPETGVHDARAYAFEGMKKLPKDKVSTPFRECSGMKDACSFLYWCKDKDGNIVRHAGWVRFAECSNDPEEEWIAKDVLKRKQSTYGNVCHPCTYSFKRPVYHRVEGTVCVTKGKRAGRAPGQARRKHKPDATKSCKAKAVQKNTARLIYEHTFTTHAHTRHTVTHTYTHTHTHTHTQKKQCQGYRGEDVQVYF
jgi:hypothetical protein